MDPIRSTFPTHNSRISQAMPPTGGRATLLKRASQHVATSQNELLGILNGPLFQHVMPGEAVAITHVKSESPMVLLESGFERPLLPLLPPDFEAQAELWRGMPVRGAVMDAGIGLLFTAAAFQYMGLLAVAIGAGYFLHKAAALFNVFVAKAQVEQIDEAATRVRDLLDDMRNWVRRGEDALDTQGDNLQKIYEERRDRSSAPCSGLQAPRY